METSLELVSSLVFQIDATSRFNVFTGHKQVKNFWFLLCCNSLVILLKLEFVFLLMSALIILIFNKLEKQLCFCRPWIFF